SDFAVIYPTAGLGLPRIKDDETRRAVIRAYNIVSADYFRDFSDRMTPAAVIPMHTPNEAIEELEFVTRQLGAKVGMFGSNLPRPVPSAAAEDDESRRFTVWYDVLGIDSPYDYDPVWQKCVDLGIAPTFHSGSSSQGLRLSPTNFVYNHIGHFAAAGHAVAKAIFLGGVTRRFPQLNFAFLEGGAGWGAQLFGDLIEHWERRNAKALERMDPAKLDRKLLMDLVIKHGYDDMAEALRARDGYPNPEAHLTGGRDELDDFVACEITRKQDWIDLYAKPFYFGCEADDRMNVCAFGRSNPFDTRLNAIYSSDIGHFDVIDMRDPLPEAYELVQDGLISENDFRDFTFANAVRLWGRQNPHFFEGTVRRQASCSSARRSAKCNARRCRVVGENYGRSLGQSPLDSSAMGERVLLEDRCLNRPPLLRSWCSPKANGSCRSGQATLLRRTAKERDARKPILPLRSRSFPVGCRGFWSVLPF
ncbi:MAG TPA: amidohydrolase family protein, partial [Pseudolabrys sp.]|nr:amidohydrolase family protein [Pseudolabrys sp.]